MCRLNFTYLITNGSKTSKYRLLMPSDQMLLQSTSEVGPRILRGSSSHQHLTFNSPLDMAYHLAVELLHAIFRHLEGEKQSLFSCSLVCMSWTSIAHYHLFRTIHLTERHIPSLLLPLIPHRLAQIPFDPSWGLYVKKLELRGGDYCETTVAVVVRKLPGLRVFILKQARLLSSDLCGCLFKKCRPYKHDRPVDLLQVVAALTQLKVVQMHGVSFSEHETPEACTQHVSAPVNPDVQLESLSLKDVVLSGVRLDPFLEVFKRSPDSLKRFSFDFQRGTANSRPLHKSRSTILGGFLLAGAPSLKELIVDLRDLGLPPKCPVPPTWERLYDCACRKKFFLFISLT